MASRVPLLATFLTLSLALGAAWAQQEAATVTPPEEGVPKPSNIESWGVEEEPASTWFGMGFESRKPGSVKPRQQNSDRAVNSW